MSQNPFQIVLDSYQSLTKSFHAHLSRFLSPNSADHANPSPSSPSLLQSSRPAPHPSAGASAPLALRPKEAPSDPSLPIKAKPAVPLTKEEVGRATWTMLHAIAAQYPDQPTRQQKRDAKELMAIISRMYPCKECSQHFKEILKANPVQAGSHTEFSQWLCHVHNVVNRSLGKLTFPCERTDARWGKLDCPERSCDFDAGLDIK